jgi:hypothetical protein
MANAGSQLTVRRGRQRVAVAVFLAGMPLLHCGLWVPSALARPSSTLYYETATKAQTLAIDKLSLTAPRTSTEVVEVGNVNVFGIAVGGPYVYWTVEVGANDRGAIMRAALSGQSVRRLVGGLASPESVIAVHGFVYWSDLNAIGRVALNGSHLQRRFIVLPREKGGGVADGLASDGHQLYFSRCLDHAIGRADLNGGRVAKSFLFIGHNSCPQGIAAAAGHLFWTELGSGTIGRASADGRDAKRRWLAVRTDQGPFQVVADSAHVYWSWGGLAGTPSYTGRADADGSNLDPRFLADSLYPLALAEAGASHGG